MKTLIIVTIIVLFSYHVDAQQDDPFAELDNEIQKISPAGIAKERAEFEVWKENYLAAYQQYRVKHFGQLDDLREQLINTWGDAEVSTESKYVVYDDQSNTKTVLNYEKNEIVISLLHDKNQKADSKLIAAALNQPSISDSGDSKITSLTPLQQITGKTVDTSTINTLVTAALKHPRTENVTIQNNIEKVVDQEIVKIEQQTQAHKNQIEMILDVIEAPQNNENQEQDDNENIIAKQTQALEKEKLERIAKLREQSKKLANNEAKRAELSNKQITTYRIPLADTNDLDKASPFIQEVVAQGKRWGLAPSLLLSIMHTESYFNTRARSQIPAFGLMQIVPSSAGLDVNRFLYNKDELMTESYLYQPKPNIETGVAYVHMLNTRYLKRIENPLSRMYCIIAAYNTGMGNVARTFNPDKTRNMRKASKIINSLDPEQVFDHLINQLPYEETRNYLNRVTTRKAIYLHVDKN